MFSIQTIISQNVSIGIKMLGHICLGENMNTAFVITSGFMPRHGKVKLEGTSGLEFQGRLIQTVRPVAHLTCFVLYYKIQ